MKRSPASLTTQLALGLFAVVLIWQVAGIMLSNRREEAAVRAAIRGQVLDATVVARHMLDSWPESTWPQLLEGLGLPFQCYAVSAEPAAATAQEAGEHLLSERLAHMLRVDPATVHVSFEESPSSQVPDCSRFDSRIGSPHEGPVNHTHRFAGLRLAVALDGQRWLNVHAITVLPPSNERAADIALLLLALLGSATVLVTVHRATRGLRQLANAAERFGRGEAVEPLAEAGPREVAAATHAFNTMQQRLTRFVQDRTRLLAAVSHDLRTPLTTLRLRAELLDDREAAQRILTTLDEMQALVEATLSFARADAGEISRPVDLAALAESLVDDLVELGMNVTIKQVARLRRTCRPQALRRALRNLIENAVRYAGSACVSVCVTNNGILLIVEDDGAGIPDAALEDVLEPFVRIETSRSQETGGVGLGLSIARSIARAHGGELTLVNRAPHGLRAEIFLPA